MDLSIQKDQMVQLGRSGLPRPLPSDPMVPSRQWVQQAQLDPKFPPILKAQRVQSDQLVQFHLRQSGRMVQLVQ